MNSGWTCLSCKRNSLARAKSWQVFSGSAGWENPGKMVDKRFRQSISSPLGSLSGQLMACWGVDQESDRLWNLELATSPKEAGAIDANQPRVSTQAT